MHKIGKYILRTFAFLIHIIFLTGLTFGQEMPVLSLELFNDFQYQSLDISNDGKMLAAGGGYGIVWDVETGQEISKIFGEGYIASVCFSNDGKLLLAGADDYHAYICRTSDGSIVHTIKAATATKYTGVGYINKVLFSPDEKEFVTFESQQGWLKRWSTKTGELINNLGSGSLYPVKYHPNGIDIICRLEGVLILLDRNSGEPHQTIDNVLYFININSDDRIAYIQEINSKKRMIVFNLINDCVEMDIEWPESIDIRKLDLSDDLSKIALAKQERYDNQLLNRALFSTIGMKAYFEYTFDFEAKNKSTERDDKIITFFPDGKKLVTVNGKYVNIWDIENLTTGVLDADLLNR